MMVLSTIPKYVLACESRELIEESGTLGHWRFVLTSSLEDECLDVNDFEPDTQGQRLQLLAVVRGLEAIQQPSEVTLLTKSRYVYRGIRWNLKQWIARDWYWERFGVKVLVKDHDLWRRVAHAISFHTVRISASRPEQLCSQSLPYPNTQNRMAATQNQVKQVARSGRFATRMAAG